MRTRVRGVALRLDLGPLATRYRSMISKPHQISSHEIVSLSLTPAAAALLFWGLSQLLGGNGWFAPQFGVGLLLVAGYLVLLLVAIPLYVWTKAKFGVRWPTILVAGAACGALIPFAIHGLILFDTVLRGHYQSVAAILREGAGATIVGVAYGALMAIVFKLLVGRT